MKLKRHFKTPEGWVRRVCEERKDGTLTAPGFKVGECINPPPLDYLEVIDTGFGPRQNFADFEVERYMRDGIASFEDGYFFLSVRIKTEPVVLKYKVLRGPGYFCKHCDWTLASDDDRGIAAWAHVQSSHPGVARHLGHERINAFECDLDEAQHGLYRAVPMGEKK